MPRISRKNHSAAETAAVTSKRRVFQTAIYIRLSVEDTRKKAADSVGNQRDMLLAYLQARPDMRLHGIYEDINRTGTNFKRPAFARMIDDIQAGLVDCVLVKDLSRFGRSFAETGRYLEHVFPSLQVRFVAVNDDFDTLTANADEQFLVVPLKNLINEIYARDISKKTQSALRAKQQRGEFCGPFAPYGYVKQGLRLVADDEAADIVKQIYQWRLGGLGLAAIARKLNMLQIAPPSKHRVDMGIAKTAQPEASIWHPSAVKRMLTNPIYTGELSLGRFKSRFLSGGYAQTDESEWLVFADNHPAIVTREVYNAVQRMKKLSKN